MFSCQQLFGNVPMPEKIGSFIIDLEGCEVTAEEKELLSHPLVGGVILFTRNYDAQDQLKNLCRQIRSSRNLPLLIMVDQEGGRVQRFIHGFTRLPPIGFIGKIYDDDPHYASQLAQDCGWLMASEILAHGIDLSLAPVVDLNKNLNQVIGQRAFHANPQIVTHLAEAYIKGMREAGMASVAKHFPGHGSVTADSHISTPIDTRSLEMIEIDDMLPFASLVKTQLSAVIPAHIIFPKIDENPVGFSSIWLQEILRHRLGFTGLILSDDMNMEGANISGNYADRFLLARQAGCDFVLLCNNRCGVIQVLDTINSNIHQIDESRWRVLQGKPVLDQNSYLANNRWQKTHQNLLTVLEASQ